MSASFTGLPSDQAPIMSGVIPNGSFFFLPLVAGWLREDAAGTAR
jgi:hypothetical protein